MVARTLASLALDRRDDPSRLAFIDPAPPRVPPEPFHWIGGEAIRLGILAKEEAEMAVAAPGRIASAHGEGPRADRLPHRPLMSHGPKTSPKERVLGPSTRAGPALGRSGDG